MKKFIAVFVLIISVFAACKKDEQPLFNKPPDERLKDTLTAYQALLTTAPNGWKGFVYPKSGGVYSFYFKFTDSNRVVMLSSFDSASSVTLKESSYRLKALQQLSLIFDTYSYLHVLADPNPNVNGGAVGAGLQSDFEYYFDSSSADTIHLVGRFNGSKATLIKATPEEAAGFVGGRLGQGFLLNRILTYFQRVTTSSGSFDFHIDPSAKTISLADAAGNLSDTRLTSTYYMTFGGISFTTPLAAGNQNITSISNISFNSSNQTISCTLNNTAATISSVIVPLKVDVSAPQRWWNTAAADSSYWISVTGFHSNGIDNAYRLNTLTAGNLSYYFLIYYPNFDTTNDLFAPIFITPSQDSVKLVYGGAPKPPAYTPDGRAVFINSSFSYGNIPASGGGANTITQLFNLREYYFVQTQYGYDMVSAADGRSWINWFK